MARMRCLATTSMRVRFDTFEGLRARREYIASQLVAASTRPTGAFRYRFTTSRGD